MTAEQGHDRTAVFGDGEDWRVVGLVGEDGCQQADRDGGRGDGDDRPVRLKKRLQMRWQVVEENRDVVVRQAG